MQDILVRMMAEEDIDSLVAVEEECFSMPWSKQAFMDSYALPYTYFFVAEKHEEIAGYIGVYKLGDEADITNVAVASIYRRKGVADKLLGAVCDFAKNQSIAQITLEVRESNIPAIKLYEKHGFKRVGVRKNFYEKPVEDAIIYQYIF